MRISEEALRGYLLEEALTYLIRNTGYRLLVDPKQDPQELGWRGNGLVVFGRGAVHQADVLGELLWIPAFTYPLRLFVEAKFRSQKTSIDVVRNMIGVLLDLNQNNYPQIDRTANRTPQLRPKYSYVGVIFSTSGFSVPASDMALAHGVSLVDLGTPEFAPFCDAIRDCAAAMVVLSSGDVTDTRRPAGPFIRAIHLPGSGSAFQRLLRDHLRTKLETAHIPSQSNPEHRLSPPMWHALDRLITEIRRFGEFFVGMGRGPFMFLLRADNPARFIRYAEEHPAHQVTIHWSYDRDEGRTWTISPANASGEYRLTFRVPAPIADWVFSSENIPKAALNAKERLFSEITIYRFSGERDQLFRLRFDLQITQQNVHEVNDE